MLAKSSGKLIKRKIIDIHDDIQHRYDDYQVTQINKKDYRNLGSQNDLSSKINQSDAPYQEGQEDPEIIVIDYYNSAAGNDRAEVAERMSKVGRSSGGGGPALLSTAFKDINKVEVGKGPVHLVLVTDGDVMEMEKDREAMGDFLEANPGTCE